MDVSGALDRFQPMHRVTLIVSSAISGCVFGFLLALGLWWWGVGLALLVLALRFLTDQVLLHWCLYRESPSLSSSQRRVAYERYVNG
jgi:hypothetical protein